MEEKIRAAVALSFVLLAGLGAGACVARETPAASRAAVPAEIERFFGDYFAAVESGDPDRILALIDEDFVIKWPVGEPITDRERLRAALDGFRRSFRQEIEWQVLEARVQGGWAWVRVSERATHHPRAGGAPRVLEGSHLAILRRVRGRWLLHRDQGALNRMPSP
jgi:ketosteroid isomerase-like protein